VTQTKQPPINPERFITGVLAWTPNAGSPTAETQVRSWRFFQVPRRGRGVLAYRIIPPDTETPGKGSRGAVVVSDYGSVIGPQGTVARRPDIDDFNPAAQHSNEMFHFNHD
jgi:hypothetical protein